MLPNRLKALRKSKKMTQDELAAALGTSKQTIHRYENGIITNIPPENPRYAPLVYIGDELAEIRIIGKAVAFQSAII